VERQLIASGQGDDAALDGIREGSQIATVYQGSQFPKTKAKF